MSRDALVVGINTYSYEGLKNLKAPAQDAEAVAQLLNKYGDFIVTRLPAVKDKENDTIKVGKRTKVTVTQLENAIVQLFKPEGKASPDTALLYFSGHGLRKNRGIQEGFLATSDVNPDIGLYGLPLQWLRRILQESDVKQQIIILDCCYSGELLNFTEADPGDRGKGRDRCFIAASRPFEVAYEENDNQHSVFTTAFIKGLEPLHHRWTTNYTLVERLNQENHLFPQRPIFSNSGQTINLTRKWITVVQSSTTFKQAICPYRGLRYFDCIEEDAKFFYGRTALTDELLEKVRLGNFLAVLGASGSGKSSVVRAGLLYQLKLGQRLSGSEAWLIKIFKPGESPLQSLALTFLNTELSGVEHASRLAQAEELIAKSADGLRQLVNSLVIDDTQKLVLVVDQFEETFTLCKNNEERQKFFECLFKGLQQCGDKLCLVLTMRSDFFGKCTEQEYSGLAPQIQQNLVTVTPMAREELKKAIIEPAKQVKLEIEPELVEEMIVDVTNAPGRLPLLQDTLTELWKKRTDNCFRLNTYVHLGRVTGTLCQRATAVYESFDKEEKAVCKHIFLALTQLGESTEDTLRRCLKQDLIDKRYSENLVDKVVERLADEKLIVTNEVVAKRGTSEKVAVLDVTHEALIRHWTLLRNWIDENRELMIKRRAIISTIRELRKRGSVNFSGADLSNLNMNNADLSYTDLSYADLSYTDLSYANLNYADLNRANLSNTNLSSTNLIGSNLKNSLYNKQTQLPKDFIPTNQKMYLIAPETEISDGDITDADLSNANLRSADLSRANLSYVNLSNTNLSRASLSNTNLSCANLSNANLIAADLSGANLSGANLSGADLSNADLSNADLSGAKLYDADLSNTDLSGAKLSIIILSGCNLSGCNLSGANLSRADLSNADLSNADISDANLNGADLNGANLSNTDLSGTNLIHTDLSSANLIGSNLKNSLYNKQTQLPEYRKIYLFIPGANLSGVEFNGTELSGINLNSADLSYADFSNADLSYANLSNANLNHSKLINAKLNNSNLSNTNFLFANLSSTNLSSANLSSANLSSANLSGANLIRANLSGANLSGANLSGANLSGANLSSANLIRANLIRADLIHADLRNARFRGNMWREAFNLSQIKKAKNWKKAIYSPEFRKKLGLPPEE